jgi:hypothetical protein
VQVFAEGRLVGYLAKQSAALLCSRIAARTAASGPVVVHANLTSGWKREDSEGYFGIVLWLPEFDSL